MLVHRDIKIIKHHMMAKLGKVLVLDVDLLRRMARSASRKESRQRAVAIPGVKCHWRPEAVSSLHGYAFTEPAAWQYLSECLHEAADAIASGQKAGCNPSNETIQVYETEIHCTHRRVAYEFIASKNLSKAVFVSYIFNISNDNIYGKSFHYAIYDNLS